MAFPAVTSIQDCANYSLVVEPFIPQLYELPVRLSSIFTSSDGDSSIFNGLITLYSETNPLIWGFETSLIFACLFLIVSEINQNFSQVDRMWSILPNLYVAHYSVWARVHGLPHEKIDLATFATTFWSVRLTFNYWRKDGYTRGSEDYRWEIIKGYMPRWAFFILNVIFISFIQSVLLFAFSGVPAYLIFLAGTREIYIQGGDLSYFAICLVLVLFEYVSDGQQWDYQSSKRQYLATAKVPKGYTQTELDRGFITRGLFRFMRHPNFVGEQLFWYTLYQWACLATQYHAWWAFSGSCALILLFQFSTALTEAITSSKYPEYKIYQNQVGMFFPTSFYGFTEPPPKMPKIIRMKDLDKRWVEKESKKHK